MTFRRKTKDERRKKCHCEGVARGNLVIFALAFALSLILLACGDSSDTAGVISETESGHQIAGVVVDASGKPVAGAELVLVTGDFVAARRVPVATAVSAEDGSFKFDYSYGMNDVFHGVTGHRVFATTAEGLSAMQNVEWDTDSAKLELAESALLQIEPYVYNLKANDTLCIYGTPYCEAMTEEKFNADELLEFHLPAMHVDTIVPIFNSVPSYAEFQVDVEAGDSIVVNFFSKAEETYTMKVPEGAVTGFTLPGLVLPMKNNPGDGEYCIGFSNGESGCNAGGVYATLPLLTLDSVMEYGYAKRYNNVVDGKKFSQPLIYDEQHTFPPEKSEIFIADDKALGKNNRRHRTLWFKFDGEAMSDTGHVIMYYGSKQDARLELRQCTEDKQVACVRITSGLDDASVDTTLYGAAKVFDGEWHSYTISIYEKHLTIVVDGKVLRNTDIKVAPEFYEGGFLLLDTTGNLKVKAMMVGDFDEDILLDDPDKKWDKLLAWIQTEHYLFNDYFGF